MSEERHSLAESLEEFPPDTVRHEFRSSGEKWVTWASLWRGAAVALGLYLSPHTNGPEMGVLNVEEDTRPPSVRRADLDYKDELIQAFRIRLERIDEWPQDDRNYGPGPRPSERSSCWARSWSTRKDSGPSGSASRDSSSPRSTKTPTCRSCWRNATSARSNSLTPPSH